MRAHTQVRADARTCMHMHTHSKTCTQTHTYTSIHTEKPRYTQTHICAFTHTLTHTTVFPAQLFCIQYCPVCSIMRIYTYTYHWSLLHILLLSLISTRRSVVIAMVPRTDWFPTWAGSGVLYVVGLSQCLLLLCGRCVTGAPRCLGSLGRWWLCLLSWNDHRLKHGHKLWVINKNNVLSSAKGSFACLLLT